MHVRYVALFVSALGLLPGAAVAAPPSAPMAPAREAAAPAVGQRAAQARADIQKTLGFVPGFLKATPDEAIPGAWAEFKGFQMNTDTAVPSKVKELIGLAVSAQIPCSYCIYAHTNFAKGAGATEREVGEAVVLGASTRRWSTVLNGIQTDEAAFRQEIAKWVAHAKESANQPPAKPMELTDAESARKDIEQTFGTLPDFFRRYPDQALVGAWTEMRDVDLNPNTALSAKEKDLIGLAVSSQIPCRYCIIFDTEFAKLDGASEQEINEAIAVAAVTRHWSTVLNGLQVDEAGFHKDVDRIVKGAKKQPSRKQAMR